MPVPIKKAVSLLLFAAMLAGSVLLGWGTGWVSHSESHSGNAVHSDAQRQSSDDSTHAQLTDAQHQLLHEVSHHPLALVPTVEHSLPLPNPTAHRSLAQPPVPSLAIAPPLRPPRGTLSL
ncbi:hypothetical protein [Achromobacter mucicolens]|nr:hypothetical protein [Achromobacter mucicolens]